MTLPRPRQRDLGDLRHVGAVTLHDREAVEVPARRITEARLPGDEVEHLEEARLLLAAAPCGTRSGFFFAAHRQLVHETLGDEAVERVAHRAPVADVDADLLLLEVHVHVRHVVGVVSRGLDRERIDHLLGDRRETCAR